MALCPVYNNKCITVQRKNVWQTWILRLLPSIQMVLWDENIYLPGLRCLPKNTWLIISKQKVPFANSFKMFQDLPSFIVLWRLPTSSAVLDSSYASYHITHFSLSVYSKKNYVWKCICVSLQLWLYNSRGFCAVSINGWCIVDKNEQK